MELAYVSTRILQMVKFIFEIKVRVVAVFGKFNGDVVEWEIFLDNLNDILD